VPCGYNQSVSADSRSFMEAQKIFWLTDQQTFPPPVTKREKNRRHDTNVKDMLPHLSLGALYTNVQHSDTTIACLVANPLVWERSHHLVGPPKNIQTEGNTNRHHTTNVRATNAYLCVRRSHIPCGNPAKNNGALAGSWRSMLANTHPIASADTERGQDMRARDRLETTRILHRERKSRMCLLRPWKSIMKHEQCKYKLARGHRDGHPKNIFRAGCEERAWRRRA
jgi:hypothetical protein